MRVLVTGGTGFVGAHSAAALLTAGHEVVVLARERSRVAAALTPLGVAEDRVDVVVGDVLDPASVQRALGDVDGLLHAANVYSLNAADAAVMRRVNVDGTRLVLEAALDRGLDPVVHVSSVVALLPSDRLTNASPVGNPHGPYLRSKAVAETLARGLQDDDAPVVITHPGGVQGPHQPHVGESATLIRNILRGRLRLVTDGAVTVVDIRDVAAAHARLFTPGLGPRRYLMGGHHLPFPDLYRHLERIVGHRLPRVAVPSRLAMAMGRLADVAQRRGIDPGFSSAGGWLVLEQPPVADDDTQRELGVSWRPMIDTLRDTVAWLHDKGLVSDRQAGNAAGVPWRADDSPEPGTR